MASKIIKRWITKAGLHAMVQEGKETIAHVGVPKDHAHFAQLRARLAQQKPEVHAVTTSGLVRSGVLGDPGMTEEERKLWWFSFAPGEEARIADIEQSAEALARVLEA